MPPSVGALAPHGGREAEARSEGLRACRRAGRRTRWKDPSASGRADSGAAAGPSGLAEQCVEKSVLIVACAGRRRQELGAAASNKGSKGEGFAQRFGMSRAERRNLRLVFGVEDRAG